MAEECTLFRMHCLSHMIEAVYSFRVHCLYGTAGQCTLYRVYCLCDPRAVYLFEGALSLGPKAVYSSEGCTVSDICQRQCFLQRALSLWGGTRRRAFARPGAPRRDWQDSLCRSVCWGSAQPRPNVLGMELQVVLEDDLGVVFRLRRNTNEFFASKNSLVFRFERNRRENHRFSRIFEQSSKIH